MHLFAWLECNALNAVALLQWEVNTFCQFIREALIFPERAGFEEQLRPRA